MCEFEYRARLGCPDMLPRQRFRGSLGTGGWRLELVAAGRSLMPTSLNEAKGQESSSDSRSPPGPDFIRSTRLVSPKTVAPFEQARR